MNIEKAIRLERKHFKMFLVTMFLISVILPIALVLTSLTNIFYLTYLAVIEILIVLAIIIKLNAYRVEYRCINNKLIFKTGIFTKENLIMCDKVVLVHTNKSDYDLEIVLITNVVFRNRALRPVEKNFLKRFPQLRSEYENLTKLYPEKKYYFQVIRRGGLKKYLLLDSIYRNCVKAVYTDESIQNIKIARGQTIV